MRACPRHLIVDCIFSGKCRSCFEMPRKKRPKKEPEVKDRTEEFQDWFLLQSPCRLEHREPSRRSSDPEERKWANWIHAVRYASCIRAGNISMQIDCILQSCGCVRKGHKRLFRDDGKFDMSTPYDDLPLQYRTMYDSIRALVRGPDLDRRIMLELQTRLQRTCQRLIGGLSSSSAPCSTIRRKKRRKWFSTTSRKKHRKQ